MNPIALVGAFVITVSLLMYGIGSITLQRFKIIVPGVLVFLTLGLVCDIIATTLMIIGAQETPFSLHGIVGYSALMVMFVNVFYVWRVFLKYGIDSKANYNLLLYAKYAYGWWIIAYFTGSLLILWR